MNAYKNPYSPSQVSTKVAQLKQAGQGMTEYIIVVALIAVAAIGVFRLFGDTMRQQMSGLAMEMSGQSGESEINKAKGSASAAAAASSEKKDLGNYSAGNQAEENSGN